VCSVPVFEIPIRNHRSAQVKIILHAFSTKGQSLQRCVASPDILIGFVLCRLPMNSMIYTYYLIHYTCDLSLTCAVGLHLRATRTDHRGSLLAPMGHGQQDSNGPPAGSFDATSGERGTPASSFDNLNGALFPADAEQLPYPSGRGRSVASCCGPGHDRRYSPAAPPLSPTRNGLAPLSDGPTFSRGSAGFVPLSSSWINVPCMMIASHAWGSACSD
jgi:hypothetical protein